jgi:hypothetical protein
MRTITTDERQLILDVTGEGLTPLPAAALEKDVFVTEVLQRLADIDAEGIQLIFCGGTCLSKAYGLIGRMSEDIDFKVVLPTGISRSQKSRMLSHFKKHLIALLAAEWDVMWDVRDVMWDVSNRGKLCILSLVISDLFE